MKIAIADDHPLVINGLQHIISNSQDMELIGCYMNGAELLKGLASVPALPDVLLLDIQMPGQTGDELATVIRECYPTIKMLALTNQDNVYYIKTMLRKGVLGYILKTTREEILLDAIRTVNSGKQYLEQTLQQKLAQDSLQTKKELSAAPILSRRELQILAHIATNHTSQQIADKLALSKRTVDNHRMSLMMKLGAKNVASLIKRALQLGLVG